jgi:hypothetical protein
VPFCLRVPCWKSVLCEAMQTFCSCQRAEVKRSSKEFQEFEVRACLYAIVKGSPTKWDNVLRGNRITAA